MPFERNLWNWMREGVKPLVGGRRLHICRVENAVVTGYPDVEGCYEGESFHLELKGSLRPARHTTDVSVGIDPAQVLWLERRWSVGGSCFVLLRVGSGAAVRRYLVRGDQCRVLLGGATEDRVLGLSIVAPDSDPVWIVRAAAGYRRLRRQESCEST
jgi:hypothetical protein